MSEQTHAEKYPEHEKHREATETGRPEGAVIQDFLEWLDQQAIHLAEYVTEGHDILNRPIETLYDTSRPRQTIIYGFLGVDPETMDREKNAMLDELRATMGGDGA